MTRPLFNSSIDDLKAMAERNWQNAAELDLILSELKHRNTDASLRLRKTVETWIADCSKEAPKSDASDMSKSNVSDDVKRWTSEAIAKLRSKLIDLSRKSPLISFKHGARSASQLRIVDERPDLLFEALSENPMGFEPLPGEDATPPDERTPQFQIAYERARLTDEQYLLETEGLGEDESEARAWQDAERGLRSRVREQLGLPKLQYGKGIDVGSIARAHGFDPSFDLKFSDDDDLADHHEDEHIRVLLTRKELDHRLKTIWDRSGTHLRETGLHTLHLAFGFVQWFEDDTSDIPMHAPLLLLPVALDREVKRGRFEYTLRALEDGLEVNIALIEKAREHWGLKLPELREQEKPESYFIRARAILEKGNRLSLRNFITLAVLPPMILWKDLDPGIWPENAFALHRLLPGLIGAKDLSSAAPLGETIDIDDPARAAAIPALITDADASQHSAIIDMAAGHDLAIEGPPGTGKSQTITNMIATALSKGKRVLFVAEKQAALTVVANRLRVAGFGPLLLELHGDRANRGDVYEGLRHRLEYRPEHNANQLEEKRAELRRHRDLLRRYMTLVRTKVGKLGRTAYDLAWREIRLRESLDRGQIRAAETRWNPSDPLALDTLTLIENRERLDQYGKALQAIEAASGGGRRTLWSSATSLDAFDQSRALDAAAELSSRAAAVAAAAEQIEALGIVLPTADGPIEEAKLQLGQLAPLSCDDDRIVKSVIENKQECLQLLRGQSTWRELCQSLSDDVHDPGHVTEVQVEALARALNIEELPDTAGEATSRRASMEQLLAQLVDLDADVERFTTRTQASNAIKVDKALSVLRQITQLGTMAPQVAALTSRSLLDSYAVSVLNTADAEAQSLCAERDEVLASFSPEVRALEVSEVEAIAETLESTAILRRAFSKYRMARRKAKHLLVVNDNRLGTASILRRLARFLRQRSAFLSESKARALFPTLLWEGIDSDFTSLRIAASELNNASSALAAVDESDLVAWWSNASQQERQRLHATASRLLPLFEMMLDAGLGQCSVGELSGRCEARIEVLRNLEDSLHEVGAVPNCKLKRGSETIASLLRQIVQARDNFERGSEAVEWVTDISAPLDKLESCLSEIDRLEHLEGPIEIATTLRNQHGPIAYLVALDQAKDAFVEAVEEWFETRRDFRELTGVCADELAPGQSWSLLSGLLDDMAHDAKGASLTADLLKYQGALDEMGLSAFSKMAIENIVPSHALADMYELLAVLAVLNVYLGADGSELRRLGSLSLDESRRSFRRIDKQLHSLEAMAIVTGRLNDSVPQGVGYGRKADYSEMALISNEVNLKRPRTPMRDVLHRAGAALQSLKPVWMMSPTSLAQFVRPGSRSFDLLIIDEASQMRPEFSISSIMRADQLVVVGDANQLPPSDHFQVAGSTEEDEDSVGVDESTESILDLANQRLGQKRRLKWHYRSQHESLIQFSNRAFYDRDLVVFPSPRGNDDDLLGVKCIYVPSLHPDTVYEASINQREAEVVIQEAYNLMLTHPELSIGIVAMNAKQTELIQNEFDRLILEEDKVRNYVESFRDTIDEFFIKNLENVQGDERDIILISTVYGPGKEGKVRQNFGLMNREVGWRRLNVLVTRAKLSCRLITSLRPNDIKVIDTSSRGVTSFQSYLTYAHGGAYVDEASGGEPDSDFEIFVADALRGAGYEVIYQVGVAGFRIDLGVRHKDCPIGFLAGIECDGASYHSGVSVRDRDHIRQTVLERLGWKIYRVWSTDWFSDPARETAKLIQWVNELRDRIVAELADPLGGIKELQPVLVESAEEPVGSDSSAIRAETPTIEVPESDGLREPRGREMRTIGDFSWYEAERGRLYEVWINDGFIGEVEVLKRATAAPRLYGDRAMAAQSEYEGRVETTGDRFLSYDLYAAVREVAKRGGC